MRYGADGGIEEIPIEKGDPWAGLGMDGETLEAKVVCFCLR